MQINSVPELLVLPPRLMPIISEYNNYRTLLLDGGRGCVHRDTLIDTPTGQVKISDFKGGEIYTYDGNGVTTVYATKPIAYAPVDLYEVLFNNGRKIICTDQHKFFTSSGWQRLSSLCQGDGVLIMPKKSFSSPPRSISDTCLFACLQDVRHCFYKLLGYQYCYWQDYRLYDEQLLHAANTYQDVLQQLVCEQQHIYRVWMRTDAKEREHKHNLLQFSHLLANLASLLEEEEHNCVASENHISEISSVLLSVSYQFSLLFRENNTHHELIQMCAKQFLDLVPLINQDKTLQTVFGILTCGVDDNSFSSSIDCNHNHLTKIQSISHHSNDNYYDFFVPIYNNYLSNGIVNHNSGKSMAAGRFILYLGDRYNLRIVCGREQQNSIEESVYTLLKDLIKAYNLNYNVMAHEIRHRSNGTTIKFKGFREQGSVNIKGLEGVDILWIDEAQSVQKSTLDVIVPTIRKEHAKMIFTLNRFLRDDAVPEMFVGRADCLHIVINYFDNPFCPLVLKNEAELCKNKSERDYKHIWLGEPLAASGDYLFNFDKLHAAIDRQPFGDMFVKQRVMGIDFAAQGDDLCVATILDRVSNQHWQVTEQIAWDEPDAMVSVGKIVQLVGTHKPDVSILDVGGMGHVVHNRLSEVGVKIERFDGGSTAGVDVVHYVNARANAYYTLVDWLDSEFLIIPAKNKIIVKQAEKIKMKFRSDGRRIIEPKADMKKNGNESPDHVDSLMMAVWGAVTHLGRGANSEAARSGLKVIRKSGTRRTR